MAPRERRKRSPGVAKRSRDLRKVATSARGYAPQHATRAAEAKGTLACERAAVHGRVGATLAALGHPARPARLDTGTTRPGTRSEKLDVIRDRPRWGDAVRDVELARARPTIVPSATHTASPTSTLSARLASESTPV